MKYKIIALIVLLLLLAGAVELQKMAKQAVGEASVTATAADSISDETIALKYSPEKFGLAVTRDQIPEGSYIPPCDIDFNYCFYHLDTKYEGTNYDIAGMRVFKRTDLTDEVSCLKTPLAGYGPVNPDFTKAENAYSSAVYGNVGDAAAGHYANGALYRLFVKKGSHCYEFQVRIAESQFLNYPAGTIEEFTLAMRDEVKAELEALISAVTLKTGEKDLFVY